MARHLPLTYPQQRLWIGVNDFHAEAQPVGGEPVGHGFHQNVVFRVSADSSLLIHAGFVNHVHHAADTVLGEKDRFTVVSQGTHQLIHFRSLWNRRIEMEVTRPDAGWIFHSHAAAVGRLFTPCGLPDRAARVAGGSDFEMTVETPAGEQYEPGLVK